MSQIRAALASNRVTRADSFDPLAAKVMRCGYARDRDAAAGRALRRNTLQTLGHLEFEVGFHGRDRALRGDSGMEIRPDAV
jgi:hypothetical protein